MELYLIKEADDGERTIWDLKKDSETGLILINVRPEVMKIDLHYLPKEDKEV